MRKNVLSLLNATIQLAGERLHYSDSVTPPGVGVTREHRLSLETLREMTRDANIWASLLLRSVATFPGYQILPRDDSDEGQFTSRIITRIVKGMPGSFLRVVQEDIEIENLVAGWCVAELVQDDVVIDGIPYVGLAGIKVKPAESFENNIEVDKYGNLVRIRQMTIDGMIDADLSRTLYVTNEASPSFPYGRSALDPAHDPWKEKRHCFRAWAHYCDVFGGGRYLAYLPQNDWERWATTVFNILKGMQTGTVAVLPKSADITPQEPSGTGAHVYLQNFSECEKQIRLAILGQELINAEGDKAGTYGSRKSETSLLMQMFAGKGDILSEQLSEQILQKICDWNHIGPCPIIRPVPEPTQDDDIAAVLTALSDAYVKGLFTVAIPEQTQIELANSLLAKIGVRGIEGDSENLLQRKKLSAPAAHDHKHLTLPSPGSGSRRILSAAPGIRSRTEILKEKGELVRAENEAVQEISKVWASMVPQVTEAILTPLVDKRSRNWLFAEKLDPVAIRKAADEGITTGGSQIRDTLYAHALGNWRRGWKSARRMMPSRIQQETPEDPLQGKGQAWEAWISSRKTILTPGASDGASRRSLAGGFSYTGRRISPQVAAQFLNNDIFMVLQNHYTTLAENTYYLLRDSLFGFKGPEETARILAGYLSEFGMARYAQTIVDTMLAYAYNEGRMCLFREFEDSTGTDSSSIVGYEVVAVMDSVTTEECENWDGVFFTVDDPSRIEPPLHYGCRTILVPVFGDDELWSGGAWAAKTETARLRGLYPPQRGFGGA